jgi:ceramide glucosyltransferase
MTAAAFLLAGLRLVVAAIGVLGTLHALVSMVAVRRFFRPGRSPPHSDGPMPAVTLLKPLHGVEPGLADNLASFARQDYPAPVQILCGVQDPDDPALAVVETLQRQGLALETVVDPLQHGANRKVGNLVNTMAAARHPVLVVADSDMRVPHDYLRRIVSELAGPRIGLVTCLYRGVPTVGPWSVLAAAGINYHFLPNVLAGGLLGAAPGCFGSTMALRRETLERLGGFAALADRLADDYALGAEVRALGLEVLTSRLVIDHLSHEASAASLWAHELRWARTIRLLSPWGHAGTLVTHAIPGALLFAALAPAAPLAWALLAAALLARLGLAAAVDGALGIRPRAWPVVVARDLLSFAVFLGSLLGRGVLWRGRRYRVGRDGVMAEQ